MIRLQCNTRFITGRYQLRQIVIAAEGMMISLFSLRWQLLSVLRTGL
jgi:hypothetical protein